jgi:putative restriction endonuclease
MKGVFDTKPNSGYDDQITSRYHFEGTLYRERATAMIGDWIVYREPQRNGGRRAYVAAARVLGVEDDPNLKGHYYALLADFIPFDPPVPFRSEEGYREASLRKIDDPSAVGRSLRGESIRILSDHDFAAIARAGIAETLEPSNFRRLNIEPTLQDPMTSALLQAPIEVQEREIVQILLNRKVRDANFRKQVCDAYENRCAVTRLKIINGGGRAEVQAAHIWPVSEGGPDVVQNGLALSGTAHWLFDRHLISITDDYRLLVSHNRVPSELRSLFSEQMERIHLPRHLINMPSPVYLARHREAFLGN